MLVQVIYRFGPFKLDPTSRVLLRDGRKVRLPMKALEVLLVLLERHPEAVGKADLIESVWKDPRASDNTFHVTLSALRKALGDHSEWIARTANGYLFVGKLQKVLESAMGSEARRIRNGRVAGVRMLKGWKALTSRLAGNSSFGVDLSYVLLASGIYAAHFAIALLLEVAYRFNLYGTRILAVSPVLLCWIFMTSLVGLKLAARSAVQRRRFGLLISVSVFLVAAFMAFVAAAVVLPNAAVTRARFQTYTAPAAYLKDTIYILPIAVLYLAVPFHFVNAMRQELDVGNCEAVFGVLRSRGGSEPKDTIYVRIWVLGSLLVGMVVYALWGRAHLFDNLLPGPYLSLFAILHQIRNFLLFALALYCLAWYYRALNELRAYSFRV